MNEAEREYLMREILKMAKETPFSIDEIIKMAHRAAIFKQQYQENAFDLIDSLASRNQK